jgi:hypothetical protein
MDISTNTKLSTAYYQTRNARRAHTKGTEIDMDTGTTKHITKPAIGALDNIPGILGTFLASRTNVNTNTHQNFSSSFDPTDYTCITCSTPHNVTKQQDTSTPLTIVLCDQFVHVSRDTVPLKFNLLIKLVTLFLYYNNNIIILLTLSL